MILFRRIAIFEPVLILGEREVDQQFGLREEKLCLGWFNRCLERGADCIMLRQRSRPEDPEDREWDDALLFNLLRLTDKHELPFLLNTPDPDLSVRCTGIHVKDRASLAPPEEGAKDRLFGKSIHDRKAAQIAEAFKFDYLFYSPVFRTESHPYAEPKGLEALAKVCAGVNIPVFALGGVTLENMESCLAAGAFGIAGIRMWL